MENHHVIITPRAKENIYEIYKYIALDNPERADSFINEIKKLINSNLSIFPFSGRLAENISSYQEIRIISYGNYNAYYRVIEDREVVQVLSVLNARRDTSSIMKGYY